MALYKNLSGGVSKIGYVCKQAPNDPTAFIYASANETNILGIVTKSVPKNELCEIATTGTTKVFVFERVSQGAIIRSAKSADRISRGTCKAAKSTDTPYFTIGTALESGKGLIKVALNLSGGSAAEGYVPYIGAIGDVDLGSNDFSTTGNVTIPSYDIFVIAMAISL